MTLAKGEIMSCQLTRPVSRRSFLQAAASTAAGAGVASCAATALAESTAKGKPTKFQIACMTLPYSQFPFDRALKGIQSAGFEYVALGTTHRETGHSDRVPIMHSDTSLEDARNLGRRIRDRGLNPVMMFSMIYPEANNGLEVLTKRIQQASAAGIRQVLTFGHTKGGNRELWIKRFKQLAPVARDNDVMLVVKQHGGATGTGQACADIIREVNEPSIQVNYDAGNVMDYLNVDPIPDITSCADSVRSFCIKDHRNWPIDQDCGPGFGEIDHYRLLHPVAFKGTEMPLCCENIFAPLVRRPSDPAGLDDLARRARQFLETVIAGLHAEAVAQP